MQALPTPEDYKSRKEPRLSTFHRQRLCSSFYEYSLKRKARSHESFTVILYSLCNASYEMIAKLLRVSNVAVYK